METSANILEEQKDDKKVGKVQQMIAKFGIAGFLFFLIKGLLWLIVPAVIVWIWGPEALDSVKAFFANLFSFVINQNSLNALHF